MFDPTGFSCPICSRPSTLIFGHPECFINQNNAGPKEQAHREYEATAGFNPEFARTFHKIYEQAFHYGNGGPAAAAPAKPEPPRAIVTRMDQARIRQLLMLCHPDRHGNSETSSEVTRWLIDLKQQLEGKRL